MLWVSQRASAAGGDRSGGGSVASPRTDLGKQEFTSGMASGLGKAQVDFRAELGCTEHPGGFPTRQGWHGAHGAG